MNKKIFEIKQNYSFIVVCVLFLLSILYYGSMALQMSSIVFYPGDEIRFLALAKSLHYHGNLQVYFKIVGYDDILYSLILSVAYFFYSPEHIVDIFRLIGVVLMCSTVFPVYLLAKKMEIGRIWKLDGAVSLAVLSVLIPEMTYTAYLLEEVLLYPLFMWMLYFVYLEFSAEEDVCKFNVRLVVIFFLMYTTKTFAIVFVAAYCMVKFIYGIKKNKKAAFNAVSSGCLFLALVILLKLILWLMNGMQVGDSHYTAQVLTIFPFTFQVLVGIVRGLLFYGGYFLLFSGTVPFLVLCSRLKNAQRKDILWGVYLLTSILLTLLEVVVVIHYSENGTDLRLSRFHYRYLFYFFIPLMIFFVKYKGVLKNAVVYGVLAFELIVTVLFFVPVNAAGQGICDGIMCFILKLGNRYPGFSDTCCAIILLSLACTIVMIHMGKEKVLFGCGMALIVGATIISMPLARTIPLDNSEDKYYEDYIKIASYVNTNAGKVLCVVTDRGIADPILRHAAYTTKDFKILFVEEEIPEFTIEEDNTVVLIMGDYIHELTGSLEPIDMGTQSIKLYLADRGLVRVDESTYNITFYDYGFLIDGYDEGGLRYLNKNGISFGPYIKLPAGEYMVEITGDNLLNADFLCYSGSAGYPLTESIRTENKVILNFILTDTADNFEFSVRNTQEEIIVLENILISDIAQ